MLILHILQGFQFGGVDSLALQIAQNMHVISPAVNSEFLNADRNNIEFAAPFISLQDSGVITHIHYWTKSDGLELAFRAYQICVQRRPDALLIYPCNRPMLWLALGARLAGVARIGVAIQNTAPATFAGRRTWHRLLLWFQRLGVQAVPCTQAVVDSLHPLPRGLNLGPVIPNGCDVQAIAHRAAAARARRPPGDSRRVLMVARLDQIKDQATLMRAFALARQPGWQLQFVGDGPDRMRLEALADKLGLDSQQVFLGRRSDIPELLGQADLFAFSTTPAEGFGIVLIEAMAAGLPILASDVPACREVLKEGAAGELVPAGDQGAWSAALKQLMDSEADRAALSERALAHANSYDSRRTAQRWLEVLAACPRTKRVLN